MEDKVSITTLFLDVGGVLLTNGWDHNSRQSAAKTFNFDYNEMEERHEFIFFSLEEGKITLEEYLNHVIFFKKRTFTFDQFRDFMFAQSRPYPDMIEYVKQLKKKYGLKLAVLNNESKEINEYRIHKFHLNQFIDFYISSPYVHLRKPDADIFRLALDIAQTPVDQIVYIENTPVHVQIAEALGINCILHKNFPDTRMQLESYGLKYDN